MTKKAQRTGTFKDFSPVAIVGGYVRIHLMDDGSIELLTRPYPLSHIPMNTEMLEWIEQARIDLKAKGGATP